VDRRTHQPLSAIGLVVFATCCFGVLDTTAKTIATLVPIAIAVWTRYALQAVISTAVLWPTRGRALFQTERPRLQAARGLLLLLSSLFAFISLQHVPVGEFAAIVMATPLVVTIVANRFMGERVSALRWALVVGGFVGVVMIIRPGGANFEWTWLLPLVVVIFNTGFQLATSQLACTDNTSTTHFLTGWVGTGLATLALPFAWVWISDPTLWLRMLLMGTMGAIGHFCLTAAYARAPASTLTPYLYGHIGATMFFGWLVLGHVPDSWALAGMAVIAMCGGAGAWLSVRESKSAAKIAPPDELV
jgi:drug/metabolite transporter (DMT)-like permease